MSWINPTATVKGSNQRDEITAHLSVILRLVNKSTFHEVDALRNSAKSRLICNNSIERERLRGDVELWMRRLVHGLLPMISLLTIIHLHGAIREQLRALIYRAKQLREAIHHHVPPHATLVCFVVPDWLSDPGLRWNNERCVPFDLDVSRYYCVTVMKLLEFKRP